ncbi:hypothetical protein [Mangrovihabitans endophyticus]|uniref:Uncharacterized protein n=1 Tax=Mangrovihabitans endophyticus TaxID=1751298 RepID=A0A8J3C534_9ACTN|nr:hypothetical protein [Mangrovihabitans endophyticus]GGL19784.1 hypothetical protein GCM10012284_62990 [Mangrovihabitans endophyticus]
MALFLLLGTFCCCGVPALLAWPAAQQYPVSAVMPSAIADLRLRDDSASRHAAERLAEQMRDADVTSGTPFAGIYGDGNGKRVTVFGTTGLRITPDADLKAQLARIAEEFRLHDLTTYDLGESGAHEQCGVGRSAGKTVVVCGWSDHGSLATVVLTRRSLPESAELVGLVRSAVLTRG